MNKVLILAILFASPALTLSGEPSGGVLSAAGGRYVFGATMQSSTMHFMLDTQTGRLWKLNSKNELVPVVYKVSDGTASLTAADTAKEQKALDHPKLENDKTPSSPK